jgi:hypothetical protein
LVVLALPRNNAQFNLAAVGPHIGNEHRSVEARILRWLSPVVLVAALYATALYFVVGGAPYRAATSFISSHPVVLEQLGTVENVGLFWLSSLESSGPWGVAELRCPVKGAKQEGVVIVELKLENDLWVVTQATLVADGKRTQLSVPSSSTP